MNIQEFIAKFSIQLENVQADFINPDTMFRTLDGWDSLTALFTMEMIDETYGVKLSGDELRSANTIQELFDIIQSKK